MTITNKQLKNLPLVVIEWIDIADHKEISYSDFKRQNSDFYFVERNSTGWLAKKDNNGYVIITTIDADDEMEITAFPKGIVKSLNYITKKNKR